MPCGATSRGDTSRGDTSFGETSCGEAQVLRFDLERGFRRGLENGFVRVLSGDEADVWACLGIDFGLGCGMGLFGRGFGHVLVYGLVVGWGMHLGVVGDG